MPATSFQGGSVQLLGRFYGWSDVRLLHKAGSKPGAEVIYMNKSVTLRTEEINKTLDVLGPTGTLSPNPLNRTVFDTIYPYSRFVD
ncbi:hypothetical protein RRG08_005301 [Elysia crispata]|uniref:Uncharacterized protein n=1 Tax=Elysia crispata TaxID=231223 RepID=A0AAE0YM62_9GAST|nr:hypothetical protein RRG08_005301 [Elysia crispata]